MMQQPLISKPSMSQTGVPMLPQIMVSKLYPLISCSLLKSPQPWFWRWSSLLVIHVSIYNLRLSKQATHGLINQDQFSLSWCLSWNSYTFLSHILILPHSILSYLWSISIWSAFKVLMKLISHIWSLKAHPTHTHVPLGCYNILMGLILPPLLNY